MTANAFIDDSYDGGTANSARHSYGRITIGVAEIYGFEEDACAFHNTGCGSDTRVVGTFDCSDQDIDGNHCEPGSVESGVSMCGDNLCDNHGTGTASIAAGNYRDGQANGKPMGDPNWENNTCTSSSQCNGEPCVNGLCRHSQVWEENATGMAPEAALVLFGYAVTSSGRTDIFDDAVDLGLDIVSSSWTSDGTPCDLDSSSATEDEIENAFDDGVLVVFSAGNDNGDNATSCTLSEPVDLPKVFTVNAYDSSTTNCADFPRTRCLLDRNNCPAGGCSARGGVTANVAGFGNISDAVSAIDLVAPNMTNFHSISTGFSSYGTVDYVFFNGTSAAAPHVAGLAALEKDYRLSTGATWINNPGRLHTVMLAMGDRHFSSDPSSGTTWTTQLAATPNHWYGLGRAKMRPLHRTTYAPVAANISTYTFTQAGSVTYYPFGTNDLPSGISIVKCVTLQREDMSGKSYVSKTALEVRLRPNATASSCTGTATFTRISNNYDLKKVAAIDGAAFTDRCAEVTLDVDSTTSSGVTLNTFCYYSGITDDATP